MKKKIYAGILSVGVLIALSACSNEDDSTTSPTVTEPIKTEVQGSPYLNKIGENGQVLSADASSWEMVELIEEGLLVDNPSYITSLKTYTYEDAKSYCENLSSGGYSDFRLPTSDELELLLKVAIISQIEMSYFINYFSDPAVQYSDGNRYYNIWSSSIISDVSNLTYITRYVKLTKSSQTLADGRYPSYKGKAFCVRKW